MLTCIFSITNHSMHYTRCSWVNHWCFINHHLFHKSNWTDPRRHWICLFYVIKKQKWSVVTLSFRLSSNWSQVRNNQIHFVNFFKNSVTRNIVTVCLRSCLTEPLTGNQYLNATRQRGKIRSVFYQQVPLFDVPRVGILLVYNDFECAFKCLQHPSGTLVNCALSVQK